MEVRKRVRHHKLAKIMGDMEGLLAMDTLDKAIEI